MDRSFLQPAKISRFVLSTLELVRLNLRQYVMKVSTKRCLLTFLLSVDLTHASYVKFWRIQNVTVNFDRLETSLNFDNYLPASFYSIFIVGSKATRAIFLRHGLVFTTGFSKMSERQYSLRTPDCLDKPIVMVELDTSNGVMFPLYDPDTNLVYLCGKGDSVIRLSFSPSFDY